MFFTIAHHHSPPSPPPYEACSQGHSTALNLPTSEGGRICLVCLSNLISNPKSPTVHVSYALSQLSQALAQPQFLHSFVTFHSHFLISPLIQSLSAFNDAAIAAQIVDLVLLICDAAKDGQVYGEFVAKVTDRLSSYSLAWSCQQLQILHCLGVLLECQKSNPHVYVKDKGALVFNLIAGLQLPSEEIQGEILFVLYKIAFLVNANEDNDFSEVLDANCAKLLVLSLEALMKTQSDDVRLNCIALLTVFALRGWFENTCRNEVKDSFEAENLMQISEQTTDGRPLISLFAEAVKGPLLSSDCQVQVATLDLIFLVLACEGGTEEEITVMVEENIADYVLEILRLSGCKDPLVNSCIQVLDVLSTAEQAFRQRLAIGFATLIPVLHHVAKVPFHPAQTQLLKLVGNCVLECPGIVSRSDVEELSTIMTGMLKKNTGRESGILPETFNLACTLLVTLMKNSSSCGALSLSSLHDASRDAVLSCLGNYDKHPDQLLHSLYLLKETYAYSHAENSSEPINLDLRRGIIYVCQKDILPWFMTTINDIEEEDIILGVIETFESIMIQDTDTEIKKLAEIMVSSSWFSVLLGCLGSFPSENLKMKVYLIFSLIADLLLGEDAGQPIRGAAFHLPSDPIDLLFLLGQKSSHNMHLFSCQSAVLLILYVSSLYDDRLADDKMALASLEQYILLNGSDLLCGASPSLTIELLVNLYGLYRGLAKMSYQVPYSPEAERILFHLLTDEDWNLLSIKFHFTSLKWLFQQDKIFKILSEQMLNFCRSNSSGGSSIIAFGKNKLNLDVRSIAELIMSGHNFGSMHFVCLLGELIEQDNQEDDIISVVHTIAEIIKVMPATSDLLCVHGIASPMCNFYSHSRYSSLPDLFIDISNLVILILRSVQSESLSDDETWVAISIKLMNYLTGTRKTDCWTQESIMVISIFALVLHHSTNQVLIETSKLILLSTPLASIIKQAIAEACSKGPALVDHDEETKNGEALICLLLLIFFSLRSLSAVLPGITELHNLLKDGNEKQPIAYISLHCRDFCKLLHFGSPAIKLVSSYCLLELLNKISDQGSREPDGLNIRSGYLLSIMAILEGLIFSSDVRTSLNCSRCLSMFIDWKELDGKELAAESNIWCRMIVEELVMFLAVPRIGSTSFMIHHKPAVNVAIALLKSKETPHWMASVLDDSSLTAIVQNITRSNVSRELVLLFRELLNSGYLKAEHIASLNRVFQACRKHLYVDEVQNDTSEVQKEKESGLSDGSGKVCEILINLMSSLSSHDGLGRSQCTNEELLAEIDSFSKSLMDED
ncbi:protein PRD1 [Coffea eugenioides]|uniref:protein PRD1 n=1 Tax=Coffea eugenioides TaxID=49369 RepID=UPI000F614D33|nr:protein PRD1 [Coffea eugenioides]